MAEGNRSDHRLTPEENVAKLIISRFELSPPVNVLELARTWATVEEDSIPVLTDAVVLHHPNGERKPQIILNRNSTSQEGRRRFTLAHEIGHITIPWHGGSIACHVEEDSVSVSSEHHAFEGEANRSASELLMPSAWVEQVHGEEVLIEKTFARIVSEANVSISAARIKLLKCLPPGYACVEYDRRTSKVLRMEASNGTSLGLFLKLSDHSNLSKIINKLDFHASDGCTITRGLSGLRFWRLECREEISHIQDSRNSADILRDAVQDVFPNREWEFHTRVIYTINVHASRANQIASTREAEVIFGTMLLIFSENNMPDSKNVEAVVAHPMFEIYMAVKSVEMSRSTRVKGPRKK